MAESDAAADAPGRDEYIRLAVLLGLWGLVIVFFIGFLGFLVGEDPYFHVAIAGKMAEHGVVLREFPWATESVWVDNFFDKEWLFHLLIMVFLPFGRLAAGKLTIVVCNLAAAASLWYLFRSLKIRPPFWWLLLVPFASFGHFLERLTMCRPHVLSIAFLALCLAFMIRRRPIALALTMALYALAYTGHWQVVGIAVVYDVLYLVLDDQGRRREKLKFVLPLTLPLLAGMVVGEIVHPSFPANIKGLWFQNVLVLQQHWRGTGAFAGMEPGELGRMSWTSMALNYGPLVLCFIAAALHAIKRRQRLSREIWFLALFAGFYLLLAGRGQRFTEYFIPVGVTFVALYVSWARPVILTRRPVRLALLGLVVAYVVTGNFVGYGSKLMAQYANQINRPKYAAAADFLQTNLEPGDIVFTESWSDPPVLFYGAPEQRYLVFLDPFFFYARDAERFELWKQVKLGRHPDPLPVIRDTFGARAVFMRAPRIDGQLRKFKLHAQLEAALGEPDFISKRGEVVYLIPPKTPAAKH